MKIKGQAPRSSLSGLDAKRANGMVTRDFDLRIKAVKDGGRFEGYGSVFNVIDSYREVVAPGAFANSLAELKESGRRVPVLWQHFYDEPVGVYEGDLGGGIGLAEDEKGLRCQGRLLVDDDPLAKRAHAHLKAGSISGLSIGYYVLAESWDEKNRIRTLTELDLREISLVTFPANDDARIEEVRAKLAHGELPTKREIELALRERLGLSRDDAEAFAKGGYAALPRRDGAAGADFSSLNDRLARGLSAFDLPDFKV
jgi:HK97 family phage prohead protease